MAFTVNNTGSGGRRGRRFGGIPTNSDINIVPLVDVVLVLLIIFMITANVMEFGLDIKVPEVKQVKTTTQDLPVVGISRSGESSLNGIPTNIHLLADAIHRRFRNQTAVYVRADRQTPWDPIAQVVSELGEAKFEVKMVTAPIDSSQRR
ncbi:MAG: biopolymer transporter ExbD [Bryobacteraceae bacterium]